MNPGKGAIQVRFLEDRLAEGATITRANFVLERGLTLNTATIFLTLNKAGVSSLQEFQWTPEIEEFLLLKHPTRMETRDQEVDRFANILLNNLRLAEKNFGEDFALAVFVQILRDKPQYQLQSILDETSSASPLKSSNYSACHQYLESAIQGLSNTACWLLKYPNDLTTIEMMSNSLKIVLEDRFHITLRKNLFRK